jgi:hypothetical protein
MPATFGIRETGIAGMARSYGSPALFLITKTEPAAYPLKMPQGFG